MWLEYHDSVRDHPKLIKAARDLGIPKVHLLGHISSLWTWTLRMAPDGNLSSFSDEDIEIGAEWDGPPGKLVEVLRSRRWLDKIEDGYAVHDWPEYARHLKAAEWKRQERLRKKRQPMSGDRQPVSGDKSGIPDLSPRPTDRQTDQTDQTDQTKPIVVSAANEAFEKARKAYPSTDKRGHETEWANFKKHKDWKEVVFDLEPAIRIQTYDRERKAKAGEFVPNWPGFAVWINQRRWETAYEIPIPGE
jgi:hypothetical protein